MKIKPDFPHVLDNTILDTFRSCPQKAYRAYIEHWKPQLGSVDLVAGGAFAVGLEVARNAFYRDKMTEDEAIGLGMQALVESYGNFESPYATNKTCERMLEAFEFFLHTYPLGNDGFEPMALSNGNVGIEFSFLEPLDINHPVTGDPLLFSGRADMIGTYQKSLLLEDDKTTSQLGATWGTKWELRAQFTGYCWAASRIGLPVKGVLIRGCSILKNSFGTEQVITYRGQHELDIWYEQTLRDIERMIKCWKEGYFDYNLGDACVGYRGCSFQTVCKSANPEVWLPVNFSRRIWDPATRSEIEYVEE